jgi:hypothetical protein
LFSGIAFSHRDDAAAFATGCPNNQNHSLAKEADGEKALLAIVRTVVGQGEFSTVEQLYRVGEIRAALIKRSLEFLLVELDIHAESILPA